MTTVTEPLSISLACALADVIRGCQTHSVVTMQSGGVLSVGTMRAVTHADGNFLGDSDDVREATVWLTMRSGLERFMPMGTVLNMVAEGTFAIGYDAE